MKREELDKKAELFNFGYFLVLKRLLIFIKKRVLSEFFPGEKIVQAIRHSFATVAKFKGVDPDIRRELSNYQSVSVVFFSVNRLSNV